MTPPGPIDAVASSVCDLVSRSDSALWRTSSTDTSRRAQIGTARAAANLVRMGMRLGTVRFLGEIR